MVNRYNKHLYIPGKKDSSARRKWQTFNNKETLVILCKRLTNLTCNYSSPPPRIKRRINDAGKKPNFSPNFRPFYQATEATEDDKSEETFQLC